MKKAPRSPMFSLRNCLLGLGIAGSLWAAVTVQAADTVLGSQAPYGGASGPVLTPTNPKTGTWTVIRGATSTAAKPATAATATPSSSASAPTPAPAPASLGALPAGGSVGDPLAIKGFAVAIGGALKSDNDEVWGRLVTLAGGKGARFVVFSTASEDPETSARQTIELLQRRGAVAEALPVAPKFSWVDLNKVVRDPALINKIKNARGVFFTGGAQERIVDVLAPGGNATPMLEAIWDVYRRGGVVAGTSAGAAIMSAVMFRDAPSVINIMKGKWVEGRQIDRGLGFVGPDLFVDQHFLKRGRFGRMIPLMMAKGYKLGLGVDENTAAIMHGDEVEVIGGKGALLVDLNEVKTDPTLGAFNVTNARLSYLDHGDRFNLKTRVTTPSAVKLRGDKLDANAADFKPYYTEELFHLDMLGDSTISNAMSYLIDSNRNEVRGLTFDVLPKPGDPVAELGFLFRLYKGRGSYGWSTDELGGEEYTVINVYLDITPVRMPQPIYGPWTGPVGHVGPAGSAAERGDGPQ
ncbi:cyanophycinase [Roseateles koreensis]|uniref:Cyanophycinase n=1 Tax=Roseateles koreensis TaxID=2987526 RepID=A0ABT5KQ64_9BURK|nr:cyanophycinase [Roseateles koreensis]MDC8783922.1 cyanophycinase [Roseateles koreensis]